MTWLLWRQHRLQIGLAAAALAALGIPVWITGRHLSAALRTCHDNGCAGFNLFDGYNVIADVVAVTVIVPLLIGVFWGATVVGKELDNGTAALVWTQSTTRRRWLAGKLLTLFVGTLVGSALLTAMVTWWSAAHNVAVESRFTGLEFDIQGLAPVGYSLFSAGLGLAAGVAWRRVLPAMATTVFAYVGVRMLVELGLRPHYMAPVRRTVSLIGPSQIPVGAWSQSSDVVVHGRVLTGAVRMPEACAQTATRASASSCLDRLGYHLRVTYQPRDRYWTFQWIEFGIFAGLTVLLVAGALVVLRRRDV